MWLMDTILYNAALEWMYENTWLIDEGKETQKWQTKVNTVGAWSPFSPRFPLQCIQLMWQACHLILKEQVIPAIRSMQMMHLGGGKVKPPPSGELHLMNSIISFLICASNRKQSIIACWGDHQIKWISYTIGKE